MCPEPLQPQTVRKGSGNFSGFQQLIDWKLRHEKCWEFNAVHLEPTEKLRLWRGPSFSKPALGSSMAAHEGLNGSEDWENQPTRRSRRNGHISQPICSGMLRRLPSSRKKFRSQTSDNMDGWKSRDGKSQRRSEKRREEWPDEKWKFARRCGAKHKPKSKCTKHTILGALLGHAVVPRSTCPSQKCKKLMGSDHFWKLRCRKSAHRCRAKMREAHFEVKMNTSVSEHFWKLSCRKKCTMLWHEAHFDFKSVKNWWSRNFFQVRMWFCVANAKDCAPRQKRAKREGLSTLPLRPGRQKIVIFYDDLQRCYAAWQTQYKRHVHQRC